MLFSSLLKKNFFAGGSSTNPFKNSLQGNIKSAL